MRTPYFALRCWREFVRYFLRTAMRTRDVFLRRLVREVRRASHRAEQPDTVTVGQVLADLLDTALDAAGLHAVLVIVITVDTWTPSVFSAIAVSRKPRIGDIRIGSVCGGSLLRVHLLT